MKSQRFNFSKVLLTFMFILLTSLVLVACGDSDQDLVDEALNTVAITYGSGDTQDSVTKNLTLPQTIGEVTVTWTSGNPDVITNAGVVTRPEEDTEVTLTATLTLGDAEESVQIKVTVKAAEAVTTPEEALAAIEITGDTVELVGSVYETTSDIVLPATSLGLNITWTTSNANYVAIDGSVTRPNFGIADQVVTLTATINGEEAQFLVKVLAFTEKPVSQILDEAKVALLLDGISGGVATDLDLPATVGSQGVTVTWSSSDAAVIANDGTVTRPAMGSDDVTVTLTATLSLSGESVTKEFPILVLANVEPTLYASVADVLENAAAGDFVKVEDVTVVGLTVDSYLFADSTGILAVYFGDEPTVEVGTVYDIYGLFDVYNGSPQLNNTSDSTMPSVATESDGAVTTLTPTVVDDIDAFVQDTAPSYSASNLLEYQYLEITAKVRIQGDGNYDMFFVNTDYTGGDINSDANSPHTTNAIMMYYRSNKAAFNTYDGKEVTFNAFLFSYRSDRNIYTIVFTGDAEDITYNATDAEAVEMAKVELGTMFEYEYIEAETLDLITTSEIGATIAWSSDSLLVDPLTGALTMPVTGQEDVTLTATITKGTEVGTFTVTITVGELPNSTIAEAIALGTGHLVEVTGVVTSAEYQNTYFIQDETGGIAIYTSWGDLETFLQTNINKEITIIGERAVYNGLIQLSGIKSYELVGDPAAPIAEVNVDEHHLDSASLEPFQGQLVELTGLIVIDVYEHPTYSNIEVTLVDSTSGKEIVMKWDARVTLSTAAQATIDAIAVADVLDIINPLAWNKAPYLYFTDTTVITEGTLTDVAAVAAAKATLEVDVDQPIVEDETLVLSDAYLGTAITWSSDNAAVITDAGVVTVPADNKQVTVTLTATITKGTETDTKVFEILVGDITPITTAIAAEVGDEIKVQGVVIAMEYNRTYFITDESGSIVIYTANEDLQAIFEANYGKEVVVTGTRSEYNGMRQIAPTTVEALSTGSLPTATNLDAVAITSEAMDMYQGMLVELSNLYVFDVYIDQYDNATIKLSRPAAGEEIVLKFSSYGTLTEAASTALYAIEVGDVLNITTVLAWNKGPELYYTSSTILSEGTLTDADKAAIDAADLSVDAAFAEATTITLPITGDQGSSIAWTSSDDAIINATTGAVVLPTEGQVLVTLTATVTVGTEEVQVTFESFVGTPVPDLFFSEYIEGGSNNKALEIFNPLDVAVDLADYKVVVYSNGKDFYENNITLSGTLNPGEVYVIYNSGSVQAIIDEGDVSSSVTYFNGDDAVALLKLEGETERPIDIIGKIGEDPGSSWTVGTGSTSDYTLVRKEIINMPNLVFTESEWEVYAKDEFTYLGSHTMNLPTGTTFVETFTNLDLTGSSYGAGSFVGDNGITWTYTESRGDFTRDGKAIMLDKNGDGSSLSASLTGGISSFSVEYYDAYSGAAQPELWINGVLIATAVAFDDDGDGSVYGTFTVENINITGDFTLEILAAGSQMVLDNLTWTQ